MAICFVNAPRLACLVLALAGGAAHAQPAQDTPAGATPAQITGLPAPMTDGSSGAIINQVPATRRITDPVPVPPVNRAPAPVVPPVVVDPAAGVVPTAPGATGPVLRPEIGRSSIDTLQTAPKPSGIRSPSNNATNSLSPAEASQRQLMIEREDRMRGLNKQQP